MNLKQIYKKYNHFTNQDNIVIVKDWLTITVNDVFKDILLDDHNQYKHGLYILEKQTYKTRHFNKVFLVYLEGDLVATITCDSNNPKILNGKAQITFQNHLFYTNQIEPVFYNIKKSFKLSDISLSRLDIAVDGIYMHQFLNEYLYGDQNQKETISNYVVRVDDLDNIQPVSSNRNVIKQNLYSQYNIGQFGEKKDTSSNKEAKKRSAKVIRYYNKTQEIIDKNYQKRYIQNFHEQNGLKDTVYRFEVSLTSQAFHKLDGFDIEQIFHEDFLIALFRKSIEYLFSFRLKDDSNIKRCTPIDFLSRLQTDIIYTTYKPEIRDKTRTIKTEIKNNIKRTITGFYKDQYYEKHLFREVAQNLIRDYDLHEWFKKNIPIILWEEKKEAKKYNIPWDNGIEEVLYKIAS